MRLSSASRRPGISLLEVLGATAIFLMSIVAIGELMSVSTDQAMDVQFRSRATRLCQSKLNEFSAGVEQVNGASSGEFEEEPEWTWQAEVTSESTAANLYRVKVTVSRQTTRGLVEVSMTQMVFDPQQRGHLTATAPASTSSADTAAGASGASTGGSTGAGGGAGASGNSGFGGGGNIGGFAGGAGGSAGRTGASGGNTGLGGGGGNIGGFAGGNTGRTGAGGGTGGNTGTGGNVGGAAGNTGTGGSAGRTGGMGGTTGRGPNG
jgi:Tfp pilus assembly protein PilV